MDTLKKSTTSYNPNVLFLELGPEAITKAIEGGVFTYDEMVQAREDSASFMDEVCAEWPPQRVKEFVLSEYRRKCEWTLKKISELETANNDARRRGVSFKDRQTFTAKIETLRKMFTEYKAKGLEYKKKDLRATSFFTPGDEKLIREWGYEKWLKYRLI